MIKKILFSVLMFPVVTTVAMGACTVTINSSSVSIDSDRLSTEYNCEKIQFNGTNPLKKSLIDYGTKCVIYCNNNNEWILGTKQCKSGYKPSQQYHNDQYNTTSQYYVPSLYGYYAQCIQNPSEAEETEETEETVVDPVQPVSSENPLDALIKKIEQQKKALIDKCFNGVEPK